MTRADRDPPADVAGIAHWGSLHDAWQDTLLAGSRAAHVQKEPLPAAVIIAIVEHRVGASSRAQRTVDLGPGLRERVASLRPHARDAQGRNWDIPDSDATMSTGPGGEVDFRRVVDALRDQFDIA